MRKNIKKFAGIVLCIGMFTGCAQTPDSSLVKPKGSKAVFPFHQKMEIFLEALPMKQMREKENMISDFWKTLMNMERIR